MLGPSWILWSTVCQMNEDKLKKMYRSITLVAFFFFFQIVEFLKEEQEEI